MKKTYGIRNTSYAVLEFRAGKARVRCTFKDGVVDPVNGKPATLTTGDGIVQLAIENSPKFGSQIFLMKTFGDTASAKKTADGNTVRTEAPAVCDAHEGQGNEPATGAGQESGREYPEVGSIGEAINVLKSLGAKAAQLRSVKAVLGTAEAMQVSFPNLRQE